MFESLSPQLTQETLVQLHKDVGGIAEKSDTTFELASTGTTYTPNWACIFNSAKAIKLTCVVIAYDDYIACVEFDPTQENAPQGLQIYRKEDLT